MLDLLYNWLRRRRKEQNTTLIHNKDFLNMPLSARFWALHIASVSDHGAYTKSERKAGGMAGRLSR